MESEDWKAFEIDAEMQKQVSSGHPYREFLRVPNLSCGIYTLPAGARDLQGPHDEDEVYHVLRGRARLKVAGKELAIGPGSVLYVRATSKHSFFEIDEEITILVFFASGGRAKPPEPD